VSVALPDVCLGLCANLAAVILRELWILETLDV